ncbi:MULTISPECIES: hypothetical protein [unclassified Kitasatospora]|uniref:hypothetical protein n=1 Tax=unclassified Kitasatospora TaxID=2633591 RepID=UPI0033C5F2A5
MVKKKRLWWRAGALAAQARSAGWSDALWRGAELVEPRWEDDEGPYDSYAVHGLQALALLLLAAADEHAGRVSDVLETEIRATVGDPVRAAAVVEGFVAGHTGVPGYEWLAQLAEPLLREHVPLPDMFEVPAALTDRRGTPLQWGLEWLAWALDDTGAQVPARQ